MKSKRITAAACVAMIVLSPAILARPLDQDAQTPSSTAASGNAGDRPASVDDSKPQPQPRFTTAMKNAGTAGTVVVVVEVGANGKPKSFHVMMSSGSRALDDEAVHTLKSWSYVPARKNGAPADGYVQVPITFGK